MPDLGGAGWCPGQPSHEKLLEILYRKCKMFIKLFGAYQISLKEKVGTWWKISGFTTPD